MIRFSALLVAVATVLLIAGVVTSELGLVYVAIGVSALALVALGVGTVLKRNELFGQHATVGAGEAVMSAKQPDAVAVGAGNSAGSSAGSGWGAKSPSAAGGFSDPAAWSSSTPATSAARPGWSSPTDTDAVDPWGSLPSATRFDTKPVAYSPPARPVEEPRPAEPEAESGAPEPASSDVVSPDIAAPEPEDVTAGTVEAETVATDISDSTEPEVAEPVDAADTVGADAPDNAAASEETIAPPDSATSDNALADEAPADTSGGTLADPLREVTVVPGVPRYHNARCILIRFMGEDDLEKMTVAAAREAGCSPCRACLPDQEAE